MIFVREFIGGKKCTSKKEVEKKINGCLSWRYCVLRRSQTLKNTQKVIIRQPANQPISLYPPIIISFTVPPLIQNKKSLQILVMILNCHRNENDAGKRL